MIKAINSIKIPNFFGLRKCSGVSEQLPVLINRRLRVKGINKIVGRAEQ